MNEKTHTLLSIITVCYNDISRLENTIQSISKQKNCQFEYIIIDGGSVDGTTQLANKYSDLIDVFISEKDEGIYDAMNKGINVASGEYIHFLNAGDTFISENTVKTINDSLTEKLSLYMFQVLATEPHHNKTKIFPLAFGINNWREIFHSAYCHQAAVIKKSAYMSIQCFNRKYKYFSDFDAISKIRSSDISCYKELPIPIVNFCLDGVSSNSKMAAILYKEKETILASLGVGRGILPYSTGLIRSYLFILKRNILDTIKRHDNL